MENEILEGKKTDNLEETSASGVEEEKVPELSASPVPTPEEVKDANFGGEEEKHEEEPKMVESEPVQNEEIQPEPVANENLVHEENGAVDTPALKTFTQSQVNEMVGNTRTETREKTFRYIYDRYGVKDENELDELIGNAQRYDTLKEQYDNDKLSWKQQNDASASELTDVKERIALLESGIDKERFEDAKFILKGKGLEVSLDNIQKELATHPEWQKKVEAPVGEGNFVKTGEEKVIDKPQDAEPDSKISVLGNEGVPSKVDNEEEFAMKHLFKV